MNSVNDIPLSTTQQPWIDVHAHFEMLELDPEEVLALCKSHNVGQVVNIGTNPDDNPRVLALAQKFYPQVFCTLGMHPHDAKLYDENFESFLMKNLESKEVVAVGEIGLDYYYLNSDIDTQKKVFRRQLEISIEKNLPVEIHTRDAEAETIEILNDFKGEVKGLIHCFTGTNYLRDEALNLGLNISISGIVTFKKADDLRNTVKGIPLDRLHIETDSPFLTPMPYWGKKNNPSYVVHVAQKVADIHGVELEELAQVTQNNARKLFKKLVI